MKHLLTFIFTVINLISLSQNNIGFPIQIQLPSNQTSNTNLDLYILSFNSDTLFHEKHLDLEGSTVNLIVGQGLFIDGLSQDIIDIDFSTTKLIHIYDITLTSNNLIIESKLYPTLYTIHSYKASVSDSLKNLIDVNSNSTQLLNILKWDGSKFYNTIDLTSDSSDYANQSLFVSSSDTSNFSFINSNQVDTSFNSIYADTTTYSYNSELSFFSDSTLYADTTGISYYSINDWSIDGDLGLNKSFGSNSNLKLKTNNDTRITFYTNGNISNSNNSTSINYNVDNLLITPNTINTYSYNTQSPNLNFSGGNANFHGGSNDLIMDFDTIFYTNSFTWGKNNITKGLYSTNFGSNNQVINSPSSSSLTGNSSLVIGKNNKVSQHSFAFGENVEATHYRNIALGYNVSAKTKSANVAIGFNSHAIASTALAIGFNTEANGAKSTTIGTHVQSGLFSGSFIYGDNSTSTNSLNTSNNQFLVRASGGVIFYSSPILNTGVELLSGGSGWNMVSDRNMKENITELNPEIFLKKLSKIKLYEWSYANYQERHLGPMAQSFYKKFSIGESNKYINMLDFDGVILYGSQQTLIELNSKKVEQSKIDETKQKIENEFQKLEELKQEIILLNEKLNK